MTSTPGTDPSTEGSVPVPPPPGADDSPAPGAGDTQQITPGAGDTQPLTWNPPSVVPGGRGTPAGPSTPALGIPAAPHDPWSVPASSTTGTGTPAGTPVPPPAPVYGAPGGAPAYGTPAGAPPYGAPGPGGPAAPPPGYAGYGGPGTPGPGYGAPGAPGSPWAPPQPTDGLAVASLVTSLGGLVLLGGLTGPVGIGLGIGSLSRIRRTGARGRGMAIAGIVLGALGTLVLAAIVWLFVALVQWGAQTAQDAQDALGSQQLQEALEGLEGLEGGGGSTGDLDGLLDDLTEQLEGLGGDTGTYDTLPQYTLPQDVTAGTCWEALPDYYDLSDAVVVPCDQPHGAEVVTLLTTTGVPSTDLTVDDPVWSEAYAQCDAAIDAIDPDLLAWGWSDVWLPHPDQVIAGQVTGYCVFYDDEGAGLEGPVGSGTSS